MTVTFKTQAIEHTECDVAVIRRNSPIEKLFEPHVVERREIELTGRFGLRGVFCRLQNTPVQNVFAMTYNSNKDRTIPLAVNQLPHSCNLERRLIRLCMFLIDEMSARRIALMTLGPNQCELMAAVIASACRELEAINPTNGIELVVVDKTNVSEIEKCFLCDTNVWREWNYKLISNHFGDL